MTSLVWLPIYESESEIDTKPLPQMPDLSSVPLFYIRSITF